MIAEPTFAAPHRWQRELASAFTDAESLLAYLELDPSTPSLGAAELRRFPLLVPRGYARRMTKGDPRDPLFLQIWPSPREAETMAGYGRDAVGDLACTGDGGVIRKYRGRALLIATGACAVNCRFCFRRHFPYNAHLAARAHWRRAVQSIASDPSVEEVILSGGDPLSLTDDKLAGLSEMLDGIAHVKRLRIHSRHPIVLPERVDAALLHWLERGRLRKIIVLHANHAQEIDGGVTLALEKLRDSGVTLLNQSVLLRGVNDSADALCALSEHLFANGVLPYYLHMLDAVEGAAHFDTDAARARALMREVQSRLPGYLVPRLVREESGMAAKTLLSW